MVEFPNMVERRITNLRRKWKKNDEREDVLKAKNKLSQKFPFYTKANCLVNVPLTLH